MNHENRDTRQHILDTGYQLIASKGFSNVGLSEILKYADVPKGSFYHYFQSKEQFGAALIEDYFSGYLIQLTALLQAPKTTAYERLMHYWQLWLDTQSHDACDNKCLVVKLSAEVADLSETMRLALLKGSSAVISQIAECITDGILDNSIAQQNAALSAELLYELWLGASLMNKLHQTNTPLLNAYHITQSLLTNRTIP